MHRGQELESDSGADHPVVAQSGGPSAPRQERRLVAILFADLSASTAIAASMEPEQYADLLERLRAIVDRVVPAHGGDVVRIDGDGALCIFGYPVAHEDAGRRAAEAALDLQAAMQPLDAAFAVPGRPVRLHCGIHAGTVLLRQGDLVRGKVEIIGDATNVAARLRDAARAGDILITPGTLGSDQSFFLLEGGPPITIAGRSAPLATRRILGRAHITQRFDAHADNARKPLVGRAAEQAAFRRWLDDADAPCLMAVHGDAGIGKSRFLAACADVASEQGWHVVRGFCEAYLGARPLQPFHHIAGQDADDLAGRIAAMVAAARAASASGLLLMIDDWQWSDAASADLLARISAPGALPGLRFLIASRVADIGLPADAMAEMLTLPALDRSAALAAIEGLLRSPDPFVAGRIEQAAGGSPLLIEELCHIHAAGATTPATDARGAWFDIAVQSRFARLAQPEKDLLRAAAAIGHVVPLWLLVAIRPAAADPAMRQQLRIADFLFDGDTADMLRFKHGLTRDALYAALGRDERRGLHREILDALERRAANEADQAGLLDALAYHSMAAGITDKARAYALAAGDAALAVGALDRAQAHYATCFDLADSIADASVRARHVRSVINKYGIASIVDPAEDQFARLADARDWLARAGDAPGAVRGDYWLGAIAYGVGLARQSIDYFEKARAGAELSGEQALLPQIRLKLAQSLCAAGRYAEAEAMFEHAGLHDAHPRAVFDWESLAYGLSCRGFLYADKGDFSASARCYANAHQLVAGRASPVMASILTQQAAVALWRGEWIKAAAIADACLDGSRRSRQRYQTVIALAIKAYAAWRAGGGGLPDIERVDAGARWFLSGGNSRQRSSLIFGCLTDIAAQTQDRATARRHAREMVQRIRRGSDRIGEGMAWRALARTEAAAGDHARADHYLGMAVRSATIRQSRRETAQNALCGARLMHARGDADRAATLARSAADAFAAMGMDAFMPEAEALAIR